MRLTKKRLSVAMVIALLIQGCGASDAIRSFRLALASSGPLVNSLVASGALPQSKASAIIADFDAGAACALTLQSEFSAIPKDLAKNEVRSRKLNASVRALQCWKVIVDRHNFAQHKRIKDAAAIAEGILASLVVFYSEPGVIVASAEANASVVVADEKTLEEGLKDQVEALKKAMKP